jgi:HAD superfamily hydrolase (TIGR01509 family)
MRQLEAVIFDLDGTLIDSEENYFLADEELLRRRGVVFTREDKKKYIGGGNMDMMVDLRRRYGIDHSPEALAQEKNAIYLELALRNTPVYPEMRQLWEAVRARGLPVAVASGSSPAVIAQLLERAGLLHQANVVVSAEEVARGKPAPDIFVETARRLRVAPGACVVLEDSRHGVAAAKAAGMSCIAVPYLFEKPLAEEFAAADLLFEDGMAAFDALRAMVWIEGRCG